MLETFDFEELSRERREAIARSIRAVSAEELRTMGQQIFGEGEHPWRDRFFEFIEAHKHGTFYHAVTNDGVNLLYSPDGDRGMWFLPGQGMGPLQTRGKAVMKEMAARRSS